MIDILIIIGCTLIGYLLGKYIERKIFDKGKFYQDLTSYVMLLKDNVNGRQLELSSFNLEYSQGSGKIFSDFLLNNNLKSHLSKTQKDNLTAFFSKLDCVSSQALIEHIDYYGKILNDDAQNVLQNEVAKSSIYAKLGMLLGAMVGILFV